MERDERYRVDPTTATGKRLLAELGDREGAATDLCGRDLDPEDILEWVYEENAQFDRETMAAFVTSAGFGDVRVERLDVWSPGVLVATATRQQL